MKVLFLGEFSGVYSELIPCLREMGIEVFHIAGKDGFKGFKSDLDITRTTKHNIFFLIANILGFSGLFQFIKNWRTLKYYSRGYDVVQINCPRPFNYGYFILLWYYSYLKRHNKKIFLSVMGKNNYVAKYMKKHKIDRTFSGKIELKTRIKYYKTLFLGLLPTYYLTKISNALMPCSLLYRNSYIWSDKVTELVPLSIDQSKLREPKPISDGERIKIFHGWQLGRESNKGNDVFDRVIKRVIAKYGDKVEYEVVHNVPYSVYIEKFHNCNIFIDQLYATDKGMNGLLGMAAGKVVFSGFKPDALSLYPGYEGEIIGIESHDDENYLYQQLCNLVENRELINTISINAYNFVKRYHLSSEVVKIYLKIWSKY